jgi:hypothetical protein
MRLEAGPLRLESKWNPAVHAAKETLANARETVRDTAEQGLVSSPSGVPSPDDATR